MTFEYRFRRGPTLKTDEVSSPGDRIRTKRATLAQLPVWFPRGVIDLLLNSEPAARYVPVLTAVS